MNQLKRVASVPLIVNDPYFSIWSPANHLYDCNTQSWTGKSIPIKGEMSINGEPYVFMGSTDGKKHLEQTDLIITATQTEYRFTNNNISLQLTFSTELDLENLSKISEPVTLITTKVFGLSKNEKVNFHFFFDKKMCYESLETPVLNKKVITTEDSVVQWLGKARQTPLNSSGDIIDIDWGYLYVAGKNINDFQFKESRNGIIFEYESTTTNNQNTFIVGYDDLHSIEYFGTACNGLWRKNYSSMYELLMNRLETVESSLANCQRIDEKIEKDAAKAGGDTLNFITAMAYRQAIAAHKLILDEDGEVVFLSKECSSNGCIGTVDVSYPSIPLFLLYQPELVKGMMRPIYKFAKLPVWEFPYAPHDVGRYPYANGQVYGGNGNGEVNDGLALDAYDTVFPLYSLPAEQNIYLDKYQMPIEECGNMLIMIATTYLIDHDAKFFEEHLEINLQWADYLVEHGQNPENQLCTDDFAGHLAHNTNLSLKAINALALFGKALSTLDKEKGKYYYNKAREMAGIWEKQADDGDWYRLSFDKESSWSMKYNIVWDKIFELGLFSEKVYSKELQKYQQESRVYGIPLDNRAMYTKADWIMWVARLADTPEEREAIMLPVKKYLEDTTTRVPFSDWYDTQTGKMVSFKNRTVVGACFMPLLGK